MDSSTTGCACQRYKTLEAIRRPYLNRARACAHYTIPSLFVPEGFNSNSDLYTPYQSLGARGVNNLAARLVLALLPPSSTFFRLRPKAKDVAKLDQEKKTALDKALSMVEQDILKELESRAGRVVAYEAMKNLVVGGNVLIDCTDDRFRLFHLGHYVVRRSPSGRVIELCIQECITPEDVPETIREQVKHKLAGPDGKEYKSTGDKTVHLYTHVCYEDGKYRRYQEVCGIEVPGSESSYPDGKLPYLALRWSRIDGEDYGRSHCDDYIGDLVSAEGLAKAIVELAGCSARALVLVNPSGQTNIEDLEKRPNWAIVPGREEDVHVLSANKIADLQVAKATLDGIEQRLAFAFLLNSAIQRNAERVTAEEIRYMIQELENSFGGVFSVLSQEFQSPVVTVIMSSMIRKGKVPDIKDSTDVVIVTGLDALGRTQEVNHLTQYVQTLQTSFGPQVIAQYISVSEFATRLAAGMGVQHEGLVRSEQDIANMNNVSQNQSIAEKLGPSMIREMGQSARQANEQANPAAQPPG